MWKALSAEDRQHWDDKAAKEKERFTAEKAAYTGPWRVPRKRAKKDSDAPKRNPSAFLLFTQGRRQELKKLNPGTKNQDISRMLGELWGNTSKEEKRHYIERELEERKRYKISIAEWRKQQETIKLAWKAGSTTSSPFSSIEHDIGRKVQPAILEDGLADRVHGGGDDKYDFYPCVSGDPSTSKDNCGVSAHPSHTMRRGPPQHHQQKHMYSERSPQVQYTHVCTQDVYPSAPNHYPQKPCRSLRPHQHGNNSVNDRDFSPIPFPNNYEPSHLKSHARQQRECRNDFSPSSNNSRYLEYRLQNNIKQEDTVTHHQYYCQKQQYQHALEQTIGRYLPFEQSDETNRQYVQYETKQRNSNMDHLYCQHQDHHARYNMKQEYGNLDRQCLNQQPSQHAMDQCISHNMSSGQLDNIHEQYVPLRCGGGYNSPLNMFDDGE